MAGFPAPATLSARLRKAGWALGIAMMAFLGACTRTDDHAKADIAPGGDPASLAAQKDALSAGLKAPEGKRPAWTELTPAQRQILAPLAGEWNNLPPLRKKKWLEIAARYGQMSAEEQQRMQARMREWAQLTPEQRRIARESYARAKKLGADQKSAKWERYQSLPDEEKQKLAARAEQKKNVANLPRPQSIRTAPPPAKAAAPVLPSDPADKLNSPAPVHPPAPAPADAAPAASPGEFGGDPLSTPPR